MKSLKLALASLVLVCGQALAVPYLWTDTVNPEDRLITPTSPFEFNFDITDGLNAFRPGVDSINEYFVSINLYDDGDRYSAEFALVNLPGIVGDRGFFDLTHTESGGFSILGWYELNTYGILSVVIQSLGGDFYFGDGTLYAAGDIIPTVTQPPSAEVPEPGGMLLLGAALTAAAFATRRRKL